MIDSPNTDTGTLRVAVLGTGTMGAAMSRALLRSGFRVSVWNRSPEKTKPLEDAGARVATAPADAVRDADVVVTMLFDAEAVLSVAAEFLPAVREGAIWMQSSTIGPQRCRPSPLRRRCASPSWTPPCSARRTPPSTASLTVLASGDEEARTSLQPIFDAIGSRTIDVGDRLGAASSLKLVCNTWVASLTAGVAQVARARPHVRARAHHVPRRHRRVGLGQPVRAHQGRDDSRRRSCPAVRARWSAEGSASSPSDGRIARRATALLDALEGIYATASDQGHGNEDVAWVYDAIDGPPTLAA